MDQDEKKVNEGYFMIIFHTLISENCSDRKKEKRQREKKKMKKQTNKTRSEVKFQRRFE